MPKVRLLPVREDCWDVIMEFCKSYDTTPMTVIRSLMLKSEMGEFARHIISKRYEEAKKNKLKG